MSNISKVITKDGSITFHNDSVDETYHSSSGALDEALRKHVLPSGIINVAKEKNDIVIGDVCFGLGYNSIVAIGEILKVAPECNIQMFAFENDYAILNKISQLEFDDSFSFAHKAVINLISKDSMDEENSDYSIHVFSVDNLTLTLYVGDVLTCLPKISSDTFDVVFFDPFSPKKHPHLWSQDLLSSVFNSMQRGACLTTYSCARVVRDNLRESGFEVKDGPSVGRRSPSTIAIKN